MHIAAILFSLLLLMPRAAAAQVEWQVYVNQQDSFTVNFPGQPKIAELTWRSQLGYTLPGRVYSAEKGRERFSVTVVDYRPLEEQGIARNKTCPPGNAQCRDGGETIGLLLRSRRSHETRIVRSRRRDADGRRRRRIAGTGKEG